MSGHTWRDGWQAWWELSAVCNKQYESGEELSGVQVGCKECARTPRWRHCAQGERVGIFFFFLNKIILVDDHVIKTIAFPEISIWGRFDFDMEGFNSVPLSGIWLCSTGNDAMSFLLSVYKLYMWMTIQYLANRKRFDTYLVVIESGTDSIWLDSIHLNSFKSKL